MRTARLAGVAINGVVGNKSWETTVIDDFADIRKTSLESPLMDEIEKPVRRRALIELAGHPGCRAVLIQIARITPSAAPRREVRTLLIGYM
jgi:hypothetical protein